MPRTERQKCKQGLKRPTPLPGPGSAPAVRRRHRDRPPPRQAALSTGPWAPTTIGLRPPHAVLVAPGLTSCLPSPENASWKRFAEPISIRAAKALLASVGGPSAGPIPGSKHGRNNDWPFRRGGGAFPPKTPARLIHRTLDWPHFGPVRFALSEAWHMRVLFTRHLPFDTWPLGWWMRDLGGALVQAGHEVRGPGGRRSGWPATIRFPSAGWSAERATRGRSGFPPAGFARAARLGPDFRRR